MTSRSSIPARFVRALARAVLVVALVAGAGCGDLPIPARYIPHAIDALLLGAVFHASDQATPDLPYADDGHPLHNLDVYVPLGDGPWPVIVFVHGGAWKYTTRTEYAVLGKTFTDAGFVAVLIDYRVYPEVIYPAFCDDTVDALNWVMAHVGEFGGDPERVVLMGHSAGSQLVTIALTDDRFRDRLTFDPLSIRGVAPYSGPFDFDYGDPGTIEDVMEAMGGEENYEAAMPINHVRADVPPLLLVVGEDDDLTVAEQVELYGDEMAAAGADVRVRLLPGIDHNTILLDMVAGREGPAFDELVAFAAAVLGEEPPRTDPFTFPVAGAGTEWRER